MTDALARFSPATQAWFQGAFAGPTPAQDGAWDAVSQGAHSLVVAPTGSGKTLAAFLWSLDRLATEPASSDPLRRCRVLYVSPLKALAVDVDRNLRAPLAGIRQAATRLGHPVPDIQVSMRTGDTPAEARRAFARRPGDVLITTPESLFLLLTSAAREALRGVETVILDEVHAVCATKRGAHLALSLERLDALLERPAQRIGLSATVRPVDEVARFLAGGRDVTVVQPTAAKTVELRVVVPVEDMATLGEYDPSGGAGPGGAADEFADQLGTRRRVSIWPAVEERVLDLIEDHRSTIVFANSRRLAERLTSRLNELAWERRAALEAGPPSGADAGGVGLSTAPAGPVPALPVPLRAPAELMAQAGSGAGLPPVVARAHHGSVSREQRALIEEELKAGRLPAVVATSSLELGIDMGAVDLVVQVESPPSVAAGLQRVGRAGHQVGATSQGVIFPKYRGDLVECAVVAERMRGGHIESLRYPRNPLDVLAQQVVAMVSMEEWTVEEVATLARRAAPFATLPASALESVLDMLAGRYPSDAFAELRPRLNWDRLTDTLTPRPGAQRLAVTSGGTIPDRGLFGVFLVGATGETGRRVGELDEEMVYESRVGDVFLLGSSSWRIEDITHDRVIVSPAPGEPGKMPFWHGDAAGRPVELGRALGAFVRELSTMDDEGVRARARAAGLDDWGTANLLGYLAEQRAATGHLPTDRMIVVERFRDELGDWRVCVHSPFGAQVNAPWSLIIAGRLRERYGMDVQAMHSDDGIVLRLPETESDPPPGELAVFDQAEVESMVTAEVGGSAMFAARFRESAARALLLPKRDPRRRAPLWQQRQRAAQLLAVAGEYASFPIVLETMRECLQDVFDVPGLAGLMRDIAARRVRLVEVETPAASPFARSLLFGYIGMFLYEGDAPLAERRAQALALDATLLAELLGQAELRELLDAGAVNAVETDLQWLGETRRARDVDSTADLLRVVGDLTTTEAVARGAQPDWLEALELRRRVLRVRIAGEERWVAVEDAGRLRDALGVALPVGVPEAFTEPVRDPLGDLVGRYARTHAPFHAADCAARLGLGPAVVLDVLHRLAAAGRVAVGEFRPGGAGQEWCDNEVLRLLRRRSLARLRREVEPVPVVALARFLPAWQQVATSATRGYDALARAIEQLAGAPVPASALESLVLPARVEGYTPAMLDELTAAGEVVWSGAGALPGSDGWVTLAPVDGAELVLPPAEEPAFTPLHRAVLDALDGGQALFFRALSERVLTADVSRPPADRPTDAELVTALWDLVWAGLVTNDTLAPLRARLGPGRTTHTRRRAAPRARLSGHPERMAQLRRGGHGGLGRAALPSRTGPPTVAGRWSRLPERVTDPTRRAHALAEVLLDRHGVVTRGAVATERVTGGFAAVYPVLRGLEETGRCRRGYFVESLGAAQFALPGAVDRLRGLATEPAPPATASGVDAAVGGGGRPGSGAVVLAAADPANPYGAALPWPERPDRPDRPDQPARPVRPVRLDPADPAAAAAHAVGATVTTATGSTTAGHRPGRKAGALVVLVDGELVLYVERGGRTLLSWSDDPARLTAAAAALASAVRTGALGRVAVQRADGGSVHLSPVAGPLESAGFRPTPSGFSLSART